ncbi:unnamed protein product [Laminaria digitata]
MEAAAERLLSVTRALLLVNADHGSAWNARKALVRDGVPESINVRQEIKAGFLQMALLNLIFTKHAKSPNAWAHRRWCWRNEERLRRPQTSQWRPLDVREELKVCERVADLYPKNYYAWTQRSWVVLRVVGGAIEGGATDGGVGDAEGGTSSPGEQAEELLRGELSFLNKWLTSHVSDHSALNHRKNVVSALAAVPSASGRAGLDFVDQERSSNSVLIQDYPGHESLWCYRRFLCQTFLVTAPLSVPAPVPVPVAVAAGDPLAAAGVDRYDWPRWNRAVTGWYERCVREDAEEQDSVDGEEGEEGEESEEDEHDGTDNMVEGDASDLCGVSGGGLPGAMGGGGTLEEFLGREACFALKCATDQGAWQFRQQRRHALVHLAFVSYATARVVGSNRQTAAAPETESCSESREEAFGAGAATGDTDLEVDRVVDNRDEIVGGRLTREVTGAAKLSFPLGLVSQSSAAPANPERLTAPSPCLENCRASSPSVKVRHNNRDGSRDNSSSGQGGARHCCMGFGVAKDNVVGALRSLNFFAAGLAEADGDAVKRGGGDFCGGTVPYRM